VHAVFAPVVDGDADRTDENDCQGNGNRQPESQ